MAQVSLAKEINKMARFLGCQFIVATHSPFMLGTLNAKIYNLDTPDYCVCEWNELENVRYFYRFLKSGRYYSNPYEMSGCNTGFFGSIQTSVGT